MTQLEIYKSFQFFAELIIAESLFCYGLQRRSRFALRAVGAAALCFVIFFFFPVLSNNAFYVSLMFFVLFAVTVLLSKFVYRESWLVIVFCCIAGYTTQHMTYEMFNLATNAMGVNASSPMGFYGEKMSPLFSNPLLIILYVYLYIVFYFFAFYMFGRRIKKHETITMKNPFVFVFVILILIVDILLNSIVVYFISSEGNRLYLVIAGIYNVLCCMFALYLQFEVSLRQKLETTLDAVQRLRHQEKEQYAASKENIALINMKCHDMRHQIRMIGSGGLGPQSVAEIENLINIYDSSVKTGNDALDIILTEKSLLCGRNNIKLSCIADGASLSFMTEEDIYSLFGNIVDNAVEAVMSLPPEKRTIGLNIKATDNLLSVNSHNYYDKDLYFVGGIPETTKADKQYHGFGMKSIQYICDKYGADLSIEAKNNVFNINILFILA